MLKAANGQVNTDSGSVLLKREIQVYGISEDDVQIIREKEGVIVARVHYGDTTAILKCFENEEFCREIDNYEILQRHGIPTIKVLGEGEKSILLEDIDASELWRLGEESDLSNQTVIRAIAKWYKTLHANGERYVKLYGDGMYEQWDCFRIEDIKSIKEKYNLIDNVGIDALEQHFGEVRKRLDAAPRTLCYNDFYYTNLIVKKDLSEALMFDYNLLGKGNYISDIHNVTYWFSKENKDLFLSVYGEPEEDLILLDKICAPIVSLYSAMTRDVFPGWAKEALENLQEIPELIDELVKTP